MSSRMKSGRAWAINLTLMYLFMGAGRAAAAVGISIYQQDFTTIGNSLAQALALVAGGALLTPVAFGLGWLGGKTQVSWIGARVDKPKYKEVSSNPDAWGMKGK